MEQMIQTIFFDNPDLPTKVYTYCKSLPEYNEAEREYSRYAGEIEKSFGLGTVSAAGGLLLHLRGPIGYKPIIASDWACVKRCFGPWTGNKRIGSLSYFFSRVSPWGAGEGRLRAGLGVFRRPGGEVLSRWERTQRIAGGRGRWTTAALRSA